MKSTIFSILISVLISSNSFGQDKFPKYLFRIQPLNGFIYTVSNEPHVSYPSELGEKTFGFQSGIQTSILFPVSILNIGGGIGISFDFFYDYYDEGFFPNAFLMLEIGKAKKRIPVSGIFTIGAKKSFVTNKSVFYLSGGPSFNFKSSFEKVNISLYPYFDYFFEKQNKVIYDDRYGPPVPIYYTLRFNNFTFNISIIIQLNHM